MEEDCEIVPVAQFDAVASSLPEGADIHGCLIVIAYQSGEDVMTAISSIDCASPAGGQALRASVVAQLQKISLALDVAEAESKTPAEA